MWIYHFGAGQDGLEKRNRSAYNQPMDTQNYTYMLRCSDGSFYTGWTNDLDARLLAHNAGKGAKYTRSRLPVELVYYETFATRQEAMSREWHLKRLTHEQKTKLVQGYTKFIRK
jgi:putative endonuclease